MNIGVQLYTVRELLTTADGIKTTLKAIKDIGYDSVQLFGSIELLEDCSKYSKELGIDISGVLVDVNSCENNEKRLFQLCNEYNISDIGVSSGLDDCLNQDDYIRRVNAFAAKAKDAGFTFSYHNHAHEFVKLDCGQTAMDLFLKNFDINSVNFMPDTYWLQDAGCDIRFFLEQTNGRVRILHLKDMKHTGNTHIFTEVGDGNLYMKGIVETALKNGITTFVVEQDICEIDPIESIRISYQNIKEIFGR